MFLKKVGYFSKINKAIDKTNNIKIKNILNNVLNIYKEKINTKTDEVTKKNTDKELVYEGENLAIGSAGNIISDNVSSGNKDVNANIKNQKPGTMIFGPYESDDLIEGKEYIAKFKIKIGDNNIKEFIGLADIYDEKAKFRKYKEFSGTDFLKKDTYQEIQIPFKKTGFNIEYRVFFYGLTDITIDNVTIIKKSINQENETKITKEIIDNNIEYFTVSILLDGLKENATTLEEIEKMRSQLSSINSKLKVTWALTNDFVFHEQNKPQLKKVLNMVEKYGDEIGIGYGFPNNKENLESWIIKMKEWIYMYRYNALNEIHVGGMIDDPKGVIESIPEKYRPTSVTTYAINNEQANWIKENFNINSFMGWTATQYKVDQLSGEGSPLMAYW